MPVPASAFAVALYRSTEMEVLCSAKHLAVGVSSALDREGREHLVVVAKASWRVPDPGQRPRPLRPQPLSYQDVFLGEPGESPMLYGDDFARFKPRCDVLFSACARSPGGQPVQSLRAGVQVGAMIKQIRVHGPRRWFREGGRMRLGEAQPFTVLPLHYGAAFGGRSFYRQDGESGVETFLENPVGVGWIGKRSEGHVSGSLAPSLEAPDEPVTRPDGAYRPVALSAIGRHWPQRLAYAGTYDEAWRRDVFPFLPEDFDDRFNQCAPVDQQLDYPLGGEPVRLVNLLEGVPDLQFQLPPLAGLSVQVLRTDYSTEALGSVVDTLYFETEAQRFSAVWRASTPIRRRIQEFDLIAVGPVDPAWWNAKILGLDASCSGCGGTSA